MCGNKACMAFLSPALHWHGRSDGSGSSFLAFPVLGPKRGKHPAWTAGEHLGLQGCKSLQHNRLSRPVARHKKAFCTQNREKVSLRRRANRQVVNPTSDPSALHHKWCSPRLRAFWNRPLVPFRAAARRRIMRRSAGRSARRLAPAAGASPKSGQAPPRTWLLGTPLSPPALPVFMSRLPMGRFVWPVLGLSFPVQGLPGRSFLALRAANCGPM